MTYVEATETEVPFELAVVDAALVVVDIVAPIENEPLEAKMSELFLEFVC